MINAQIQQTLKRKLIGKITSNKMNKTVTVLIKRHVKHPLYKKIIVRTHKYHAHNEFNQIKIGDVVAIQENRPISKTKFWNVTQVVKIAQSI